MLHYKLYQNSVTGSKTFGKWYARAVSDEMLGIDELAKHLALHNTPYSKGVIKGIITDMVACIRELTLSGASVKLDDLAIFSVGIKTSPANSAAAFNVTSNVQSFRLRARAPVSSHPSSSSRPPRLPSSLSIRSIRRHPSPNPVPPIPLGGRL